MMNTVGWGFLYVSKIMREYKGRIVVENTIVNVRVTGTKVSLVFPLHR